MRIIPHFTTTTVGECKPLTLIRLSLRSKAAIGITFGTDEHTVVGVFNHPDFPDPHFVSLNQTIKCVAYPEGWEIELIPNEMSVPGNNKFLSTPGLIHVDATGHLIHLFRGGSDSTFESVDLSLDTAELGTPSSRAVPFTSWRIWAGEEDRLSPNGRPVFSFEANMR